MNADTKDAVEDWEEEQSGLLQRRTVLDAQKLQQHL